LDSFTTPYVLSGFGAGNQTGGVSNFNVVDFGATGDGATNDTVAIQAAFDALVVCGGGTLYFPKGDYSVTGTLDFTGGEKFQVVGAGVSASRITCSHATRGIDIRYSEVKGNITFRNISVRGNQSGPANLIDIGQVARLAGTWL
jgi:hypothetical protein